MPDPTETIIELEKRRCALVAAGDTGGVAPLLVEDYVHIHGNGNVHDKTQYLNWLREVPRQQERSNLKVRFYGDVAILNGDILNRINYGGELRVIDAYLTQVLVKQEGAWRFAQWHITPKGDLAQQLNNRS